MIVAVTSYLLCTWNMTEWTECVKMWHIKTKVNYFNELKMAHCANKKWKKIHWKFVLGDVEELIPQLLLNPHYTK